MNWWLFAYLAFNFVGLGIVAAKHNEPRTGNWNFWSTLIVTAMTIFILYMGGAFANLAE